MEEEPIQSLVCHVIIAVLLSSMGALTVCTSNFAAQMWRISPAVKLPCFSCVAFLSLLHHKVVPFSLKG